MSLALGICATLWAAFVGAIAGYSVRLRHGSKDAMALWGKDLTLTQLRASLNAWETWAEEHGPHDQHCDCPNCAD